MSRTLDTGSVSSHFYGSQRDVCCTRIDCIRLPLSHVDVVVDHFDEHAALPWYSRPAPRA